MAEGLADRYASALTRYSRLVLVVLLAATLVMGASAGGVDGGLSIASFGSDSTEAQKLDYVRENGDISGTLAAGHPTVGVGNLVATAAVHAESRGERPPAQPTLDEQISQ